MQFTAKNKTLMLSECGMVTLCLLVTAFPAVAQEFRGSITGRVTDKTGTGVPGAQVTITNTDTNIPTIATTDEAGDYAAPFLTPGQYAVSVEATGFKKLERRGIEVRVNDKLTLDLRLELGTVRQEVRVVASAPLLDEASASTGQVIDERRISELPLSDGNPFVLTRLAPGVTYTGDLRFSRPFDNAGTSSIVVNGAPGSNEFSLDGSPNMASGGRVAYVPPSDAVSQFKIVSSAYDAQQGHTGGGGINVALKSGTNGLHGSLYEFDRNTAFTASDFFLNRAGKTKAVLRYNRYGGSIGGPLWVPGHYDGRNKTFWFFAYEGLKDAIPEPDIFTVPSAAERNGDFSALLSQNITIYDPETAKLVTSGRDKGRVRRLPMECNGGMNVICPDRLSPIAQAYLKFYPLPNTPGDAQGKRNFITPNARNDLFDSENARVDHTLTNKQKFFARFSRNWRRELRGSWTGEQNGIIPSGNYLFRVNNSATYDHLYTFSASTLLDVRVGFSRFLERNVRPSDGLIDPGTLGFSPQTVALFRGVQYLPRFNIHGFNSVGDTVGGVTTFSIYSVQPSLTKIVHRHSIRMGYEFRATRENAIDHGAAAGVYDFGADFTKGPLDNSATKPIGQELASFLLGQPTGGTIERNADRALQTLYHAAYFQDDWRASRKLTLNLGLRYELEGATTERYNRNLRGFDTTTPSPLDAIVAAAYAANPDPMGVSPADFHVRGGPLFATPQLRGFWNSDMDNFQPRVGAAYQINRKTVLRGGWGVFTVPFTISGVNQQGFSQSIPIVPTNDNGLTFRANLFDPFPDGVPDPPGSSLGLLTFLGRGLGSVPLDRENSQAQRWNINMQRELPGRWLLEAAYVGTSGYSLTVGKDLNPVPRQFLSTKPTRDDTVIGFLTTQVANPFQGFAAFTDLNKPTLQRQQLLRPFPQFTGVSSQRNDGSSIYHSGQLRAEKRFTRGYTLLLSYTWSKLLEQNSVLNATDTEFEKRVSGNDAPHRVSISSIWELPFGRGRKWGSNWRGVVNQALGGWQTGVIYQAQSGRPIGLGNHVYLGDPSQLRAIVTGTTLNNTFPTSEFYFSDAAVQNANGVVDSAKQRSDNRIKLSDNIRYLPSRIPGFRGQGLNLWDISLIKKISISERKEFQFRAEFLNATNHAEFNNPNTDPTSADFSKVTSQANLPRDVQIALKLTF